MLHLWLGSRYMDGGNFVLGVLGEEVCSMRIQLGFALWWNSFGRLASCYSLWSNVVSCILHFQSSIGEKFLNHKNLTFSFIYLMVCFTVSANYATLSS
jgi:hypothetical protein